MEKIFKKIKLLLLSMVSGTLLFAGWPPDNTAILLFFGLVPLFLVFELLKESNRKHFKFWLYSYVALFIFNTGATWWVWNASQEGCLMMLFGNSLLMSVPFLGYSWMRSFYPRLAIPAFLCFYIAFEYWHFNWSAAWPWMTFGKGLASWTWFIQWYSYTGELGGSLLILTINVLIYKFLTTKKPWLLLIPAALFASAYYISLVCRRMEISVMSDRKFNCVISQPNIDPYEEKFGDGEYYLYPELQLELAIEPTKMLVDKSTDLLVLPETAIVGFNEESKLNFLDLLQPVRILTDGKKLNVIAGAETFSVYEGKSRPGPTARYDSFSASWFDVYNTAIIIRDTKVTQIYHKSKLVPGVEKMPFQFLEALSIKLGGTSGSLKTSDSAFNFRMKNGLQVAPLICYESVFGDYTNEFVRKGANLLALVTNDGWWGQTPGYMQHLMYGTIRCIETRKEMVRSANTGISAKIDIYGNITQRTGYNKQTAIKCEVVPNNFMTFYVRFGNLVGKILSLAAGIFILMLLYQVSLILKNRIKARNSDFD